jgi:GT2 family glycosyltransferase
MRLTAIVPVWNGRELLSRLLASLEVQTLPVTELLVIDNGSTDGAPELARGRGARVVPMGHNAGFAPAVNRGIRESRSEWIAVLNSDVELASDYFAKLASAGAPFATGKILMADARDRIDATFDAVCRGGCAARLGHGCTDGPIFSERRSIWSAPWTAVLFRAEVFERVGLLNEAFESYLEDVEFGIRCAFQGVSGLYVPEAVAWHRGSATWGRWHPETVRRIARNQCYLVALHYPLRHAWEILVAQVLWGVVAARHGAGMAWLQGKIEGIRQASRLRRATTSPDRDVLEAFLTGNEQLIQDVQKATGVDRYWRLYFLLTHLTK